MKINTISSYHWWIIIDNTLNQQNFFFIFLLFLNCHLSVHFTLFMQVHKLKKEKKFRKHPEVETLVVRCVTSGLYTQPGPLLPVFVLRDKTITFIAISCRDLFSGCSWYHQCNALYIVTQKEEVSQLIPRSKLINNFENLWNVFRFRIAIINILDHFEVSARTMYHLTSGRITIHFYLVCLETNNLFLSVIYRIYRGKIYQI